MDLNILINNTTLNSSNICLINSDNLELYKNYLLNKLNDLNKMYNSNTYRTDYLFYLKNKTLLIKDILFINKEFKERNKTKI